MKNPRAHYGSAHNCAQIPSGLCQALPGQFTCGASVGFYRPSVCAVSMLRESALLFAVDGDSFLVKPILCNRLDQSISVSFKPHSLVEPMNHVHLQASP